MIRVLEYVYDSPDEAMADQERWFVPPVGSKQPNPRMSISSATMPMRLHERESDAANIIADLVGDHCPSHTERQAGCSVCDALTWLERPW